MAQQRRLGTKHTLVEGQDAETGGGGQMSLKGFLTRPKPVAKVIAPALDAFDPVEMPLVEA